MWGFGEMLAEMIGTTRSRIVFMNRFRKLGFVDYGKGGTQVHSSLLHVVLHGLASAIRTISKVHPFLNCRECCLYDCGRISGNPDIIR